MIEEIIVNPIGSKKLAIFKGSPDGSPWSIAGAIGVEPERLEQLVVEIAAGRGVIGKAAADAERYVAGDPTRADQLRRCRPQSGAVPESTDYLYPGQLFTSSEPAAVMTLLGSCVAVCLWDPESGAGGMNHFLLPHGSAVGASALRYGSLAIPELIRRVLAIGGRRDRLRAKLFGGAGLTGDGVGRLSAENVAVARSCLAEAEIPIVAEEVGGLRGRKLIFRIPEGDAWVRAI